MVVRRIFLRIAAPVLFLAAATAVVVIARSALHRTPVLTPATAPAGKPGVARAPRHLKRRYYRLQPGDTLDGVAHRFETTVHQLLLFNPGVHAESLVPGQKLRVR
jgi:hypothetical protein